jgi:hypothetical protein
VRSDRLPAAGLDRRFRRLYDLDFTGAQREFETWEKLNPEDAMGPVSEAAGVLFSEFNRVGVLEAQFYEDDSVFAARKKYEADPQKRNHFEQQRDRSENLARSRLSRDAHLASGVRRYIIGSMAAPVRWVLRLDGVSGDKAGGIAEFQTTAAKGLLLAPFARILLAIAYARAKDIPHPRELLTGLQKEFSDNALFGRELARFDRNGSR